MDIDKYEELTGFTVPSSKQARVTAQITRTQRILERLLGYTLKTSASGAVGDVNYNEYAESGKTQTDCPCPDDNLTLDDPDSVTYAYRLFPHYKDDIYLRIDPATAIHKVKLVKDLVTYYTFETDEYRADYKNGLITAIEVIEDCWCKLAVRECCNHMQLAVDATWGFTTIPDDLYQVWAEMVTWYSDPKNLQGIKSQVLGSHSYTKFDNNPPEMVSHNMDVLKLYAGPNGSLKRNITL